MNIRQALNDDADETLSLLPLVDVVFILLVFFLVTSSLSESEKELDIILPNAAAAGDIETLSNELIVNVTRDGSIIIHGKPKSRAELAAQLEDLKKISKSPSVIIRADSKAFHEYVVQVLDACAKAKLSSVSFVSCGTVTELRNYDLENLCAC